MNKFAMYLMFILRLRLTKHLKILSRKEALSKSFFLVMITKKNLTVKLLLVLSYLISFSFFK
jgi:hypothetical protein